MKLTDIFWKKYELDLQEVKISYLNWAITHAKEPAVRFRHLFLWDHQKDFCIVNSRYGRAFAISPFGLGVRGVPKPKYNGIPPGLDEIDLELKRKLSTNTYKIREAIKVFLVEDKIEEAQKAILNYYWLKLGLHELLFDRVQYGRDETGKVVKGRINIMEPDNWNTLTGIRNRIINVIRFGDNLETVYVKSLNKKLPGFSRNSYSTFISSAMTYNKYAQCAFDCGPVLWSRKGFVCFEKVKKRMKKIGWPYSGTAHKLLRPLYTIALDYKRPPIRQKGQPDEGYSRKSLKNRCCQLYEAIDNILDEINRQRQSIK
jgi:hypothetical protein